MIFVQSRPTTANHSHAMNRTSMLDETRAELADLDPPPSDYIDLQSFVHLVIKEDLKKVAPEAMADDDA